MEGRVRLGRIVNSMHSRWSDSPQKHYAKVKEIMNMYDDFGIK